jgi:hypothetical protein
MDIERWLKETAEAEAPHVPTHNVAPDFFCRAEQPRPVIEERRARKQIKSDSSLLDPQKSQTPLLNRTWMGAAKQPALAALILPRANHRVNLMHENLAVRRALSATNLSRRKSRGSMYTKAAGTNQRRQGVSPNARREKTSTTA